MRLIIVFCKQMKLVNELIVKSIGGIVENSNDC